MRKWTSVVKTIPSVQRRVVGLPCKGWTMARLYALWEDRQSSRSAYIGATASWVGRSALICIDNSVQTTFVS